MVTHPEHAQTRDAQNDQSDQNAPHVTLTLSDTARMLAKSRRMESGLWSVPPKLYAETRAASGF